MRRRLGTIVLAAVAIGGCGGGNDTVDFSDSAAATCKWARQSADVLPERSSELLKRAATHLRGVAVPDAQRAAADTLVAGLDDLSRSADQLSSELGAANPDPARLSRLRAAVQDDQQNVAATARTLGVSGCDAITGVLLRSRTAAADDASAPKSLSRAAYRSRLRTALGSLSRHTIELEAAIRSGNGSSTTLRNYAAVLGSALKRLEPLRPPARVASAHRDLVAGLHAMRAASNQAARDIRAGSTQRATRVVARYYASQAAKDLQAAITTLRKGGYLPELTGASRT
ncbi:MAG TPA: hypothetical protein VNT03_11635 [Baekduia sp.]|nr:hypothetical protein [Baekduia sp.]